MRQIKRNKLLELKNVDLAFSLYDESPKLIWDEPLNGLDILTRQGIEEAILHFNPTLIFIEHDESFIRRVATRCIHLAKIRE